MTISKITTTILDKVLFEINKKENISKIETKLVEPLIQYAFKRLYPYVVITGIIFILTFLLAVFILLLLINGRRIVV